MSIMIASSMRQTRRPRRRRGRPRLCHIDLLVHIVELRLGGARLKDICNQLNADGVPTPGLRRVPELPRFAWHVTGRAESHC
jgi:hypothetical protein